MSPWPVIEVPSAARWSVWLLFLLVYVTMPVPRATFAAEYEDDQLFPFSQQSRQATAETSVWTSGYQTITAPARTVRQSVRRSWGTVSRTTGQVWQNTREVLTPPDDLLPEIDLPQLPRPHLPDLAWPTWDGEEERSRKSDDLISDWFSMPQSLPR